MGRHGGRGHPDLRSVVGFDVPRPGDPDAGDGVQLHRRWGAGRARPTAASRGLMRFGLAFQSDKTAAQYIALAQTADRYDFDVISVYNDLLYQPAIGPLLLMAP